MYLESVPQLKVLPAAAKKIIIIIVIIIINNNNVKANVIPVIIGEVGTISM
jgi:hypothetical protein